MIKVSVVCTVYNKEKYLRKTLDSLMMQKTNFEYEIIVVDDKSTDGSKQIVEEYAGNYPELIRAYYNEKNLGITLNWIQSCEYAQGEYIARSDADDYWIDACKIQKQVELLEKSQDSKWCTTDINMVDGEDQLIHESCFKNNHIPLADSFEKMLITKGFTCPSAWLVETDLMREVNREIPKDSVDDSFCIQLELFQRTKLTLLEDVTTNYRNLKQSDSHILDEEKLDRRNQKLLESQRYYANKYHSLDYDYILDYFFDMQYNLEKVIRSQNESYGKMENAYRQLEDLYKRLEKDHQVVINSTCWKATAPVRKVKDTVLKRRK